jgi:hypothetical protein
MSSLLRLSVPRLEKAMLRAVKRDRWSEEERFSVRELCKALVRRGMSERNIHNLFGEITDVLEPPSCWMTHCKDFGGSGAPMNCALERVPGRCSIYKAYKQRKADKAKATATKETT